MTWNSLWLERAAFEGNVQMVDEVRVMEKTNGDTEEVVTEVMIPAIGVTISSYAIASEYPTWVACRISFCGYSKFPSPLVDRCINSRECDSSKIYYENICVWRLLYHRRNLNWNRLIPA